MKKKVSISIGISVYNEANNIVSLLESLLKQNKQFYNLEKILIITDASTDQTLSKIKKINSPLISVIKGTRRLGKPARVNQIFKILNNKIVVILDGDINIYSPDIIDELIKPMLRDKSIQLTSGNDIPIDPKNWVEKIANKGIVIWKDVRAHKKNACLYYCGGPIRAFGKKLYKSILFPQSSQEDSYAFLFCMQEGFGYSYAEDAKVYYRTPSKLKDFMKQTLRFLQSEKIQKNYFAPNLIRKYYVIGTADKIKSLVRNIVKDPFYTTQFFVFDVLMKFANLFVPVKDASVWEIIASTKEKINK